MIQIGKTFQNHYPKSCGSDIGSLSEWDQIMYWLLSWSITLLLVAYGRIIITLGSGLDGSHLLLSNNSALSGQLPQYHYPGIETWKAFNFRIPSNVSGYGYIPFLIVVAATIYVINVSGGSAGSELSPDAITTSKLLGDDIHFDAANENGQLRVKMLVSQSGRLPVTIIPLRKGISVESTYTGMS